MPPKPSPAQPCPALGCGATLIPQRIWSSLSPRNRLIAREYNCACAGAQGFCRGCYQRNLRHGKIQADRRSRPLPPEVLARLRELVGIPREDTSVPDPEPHNPPIRIANPDYYRLEQHDELHHLRGRPAHRNSGGR